MKEIYYHLTEEELGFELYVLFFQKEGTNPFVEMFALESLADGYYRDYNFECLGQSIVGNFLPFVLPRVYVDLDTRKGAIDFLSATSSSGVSEGAYTSVDAALCPTHDRGYKKLYNYIKGEQTL